MKHLILVGACYLDTILTVPSFPQEDSKLRASSLRIRRGGNCPNSLEVLLQLLDPNAVKTHLISTLPSAISASTSQIFTSFGPNSTSVDFAHCLYREEHDAPASSYIIRNAATGSRTIVNFNDLPEMTTDEFSRAADAILATDQAGEFWWHFEGRIPETTLQCIRHLRRVTPQSTVSVEVEKPNREGLGALAAEADIVFYSRSWAEVSDPLFLPSPYWQNCKRTRVDMILLLLSLGLGSPSRHR
ncbi:hypothetical protein OQA88_1910 [Cercophora sp. LCS_1]